MMRVASNSNGKDDESGKKNRRKEENIL